ncbi:MAG TPA: hypothetical protein VGD65_09585 [Chryseosolibacter sp.]
MKTLPLVFLFITTHALAQDPAIGLQVGSTLAGLRFRDANGRVTRLSPMPGLDTKVAFTQPIRTSKKVNWSMALGYKSVQLRDRENQVASRWSINMATFATTIHYDLVSTKRIRVNSGLGAEGNFLFNATQSRGFEQYVITNRVKRSNVSLLLDWAVEYQISAEAFCSIEALFFNGFTNVERDPGQSAYLRGFTPSIAIHFNLNSNKRR